MAPAPVSGHRVLTMANPPDDSAPASASGSTASAGQAPLPSAPGARQGLHGQLLRASAWLLAGLVLIGSLVAGAAWLAWRHEATLAWVLQQVPGMRASGVVGTLASGRLQIAHLDWQLPGGAGHLQLWQLQIEGAHADVQPRPGVLVGLKLGQVRASRLQFDSGPPSGQPLKPPADLQLPVDLQVAQLQIAESQIDQWPALRQLQARLALGAEQGRLHQIDALSLTLDSGRADAPAPVQVQGSVQIGTQLPFKVQARLSADRQAAPGWQAQAQATGPLTRLATEVSLKGIAPAGGSAASLQASAQVQPFAAWPLGDLLLTTQALDLASLSAHWPATRLSGQAEVHTLGLDRPATVNVRIANALPGTWDSGRLPIRRLLLQATAEPRQIDRLTLDQFELQLADATGSAGQVAGRGRWQGSDLALDLQLAALQPARLHRAAAAISVGGPLQLRLAGLPAARPVAVPASAASAPPPGGAKPNGAKLSLAANLHLAIDTQLTGRWLDGGGVPVQLRLVGDGGLQRFNIAQAELQAGSAHAQASGNASAEAGGWRVKGQAELADFDPLVWWRGAEGSAWRRGPHRLSAELQLSGLWRREASAVLAADTLAVDRLLTAVDGDANLLVHDSLLAGLPLSAQWRLHSQGPGVEVEGAISVAGQRFSLQGQGGGAPADDRWRAALKAPELAALAPLGNLLTESMPASARLWPKAGALSADVSTQGRWPALQSQGDVQAQSLASALAQLRSAHLQWKNGATPQSPLQAQLQAQGLSQGEQRIDRLTADITGNLRDHQVRVLVDSPARPPSWTEHLLGPADQGTRLEGQARGQWQADGQGGLGGHYRLQALNVQGGARDPQGGSRSWLAAQGLSADLALGSGGGLQSLQLAPGRVQLLTTALAWSQLQWQAAAVAEGNDRLDVSAQLETIDVARLLSRLQPEMGWGGNLTVGGHIELHSAGKVDADVVLERGGGDLSVTDELGRPQWLGLSDLRLALTAHNGLWQLAQGLAGKRIGSIAGAQVLQTTAERHWPPANAPLQGVMEARVSDLGVWGTWVPPGWRLAGALDTTAQFSGTLGAPKFTGAMTGSQLGLRNVLQGVSLTDGELAITLAGDTARIERLSFKGGDGQLTITGGASLGALPRATLHLVADRFRLLGRIDRRLVASGSAEMLLDAERLKLDGAITVDEGLFDIGSGDAPTLDSDVTVTRSVPINGANNGAVNGKPLVASPKAAAAFAPTPLRQAQVNLRLDMGQQLRLRGRGVDTALRGNLQISTPGGKIAVHGTVSTQDGRYAAYGQKMEIQRGRFTFTGEPDNPRIDVQAVRPNLDVVVGVLVDGTAYRPRIRLFSEPELPDFDKLSWLVMGRGPDGLGTTDTALLQRAAFALLAGDNASPSDQLLEAIGLTDFSLRQTDGDTRETIISLGKQLSRRWYVGYERGVHATTGTWQLIYRIAQRFTLRAQSGGENAIDLVWSWRW